MTLNFLSGSSLFSIGIAFVMFLATAAQSAATVAALDEKIAAVMPKPGEERWLTIPWRLELNKARAESQKLKRPMFLWIMNGHPMGCT